MINFEGKQVMRIQAMHRLNHLTGSSLILSRLLGKLRVLLPGFGIRFSGAGGRVTDAAHIVRVQLIGMRDEVTAALPARDHLHHSRIEKPHQKPGTGDTQYHFTALYALHLVQI